MFASMTTAISPTHDRVVTPDASASNHESHLSLEALCKCLEPYRQRPPMPASFPEEYTDEHLQQREMFIAQTRMHNSSRTPSLCRFAGCYGYFVAKARHSAADLEATEDEAERNLLKQQKFQAACQVLLFDRSRHLKSHPCDVPCHGLGDRYLTCAIVMLKYVIYTRYQYYLGRELESFNYRVNKTLKRVWCRLRSLLRETLEEFEDEDTDADSEEKSTSADARPIHTILHKLNHLLGFRHHTIEHAMESFERYSQYRHVDEGGWNSPELPTFELEELVLSGAYDKLAVVLYSDFVALDVLMRFESDDREIVHLQAVVAGLIRMCFGVKCQAGEYEHNPHEWQATSFLHLQEGFLQSGDQRFSKQLQWSLRSEAERAERQFWKGWTALCRDQGENEREVQALLGKYLRTLKVDDAAVEAQFFLIGKDVQDQSSMTCGGGELDALHEHLDSST